jgi:hypothetical protein
MRRKPWQQWWRPGQPAGQPGWHQHGHRFAYRFVCRLLVCCTGFNVRKVVTDLKEFGEVQRALLGVKMAM